jgi:hypothetical protein
VEVRVRSAKLLKNMGGAVDIRAILDCEILATIEDAVRRAAPKDR